MKDHTFNKSRIMHQEDILSTAGNNAHFLDDWPEPPKHNYPGDNDPTLLNEVKKWRLQILLAVNPWGIPSLAFGEAYRKMFGKQLDVREMGYEHLSEMVSKMPDIFAVQEPEESTALLFPDYTRDRILHDARLGFDFARPNFDSELSASRSSICTSFSSDSLATIASATRPTYGTTATKSYDELVRLAWMDRDEDFPSDVVLAGEPYDELLIISSANLPGARGLYQAKLLSAATPDSFFVQLKTSEQVARKIQELPAEIAKYFEVSKYSIDAYSVPREFMYPGFPCLVFVGKGGRTSWERCVIAALSKSSSKVLVETVDFGGWYAVDPIYLYLIPRKFLDVPRQTFQISLAGLKPPVTSSAVRDSWPAKVGPRMRCFSYHNYWLDLLLIDSKPKNYSLNYNSSSADKESLLPSAKDDRQSKAIDADVAARKAEKMRHRFRAQPRFDALVVDRNDEDIDIFLDEILILETYAIADESRKDELQVIKNNLKEVLKKIPRPNNPFYEDTRK